jgi:hypothetical protein
MAAWLNVARANRGVFLAALRVHAEGGRGCVTGELQPGVNLYKALVETHTKAGNRALVADVHGERRQFGYRELDVLAGRLARGWARAGLQAGAVVAITAPIGPEYAVALLTCMRMGLVAAPIAPLGRTWLNNRLKALTPDAIFSGRNSASTDKSLAPVLPWVRDEDAASVESSVYAPAAPALRVFSPYSQESLKTFDVSAQTLCEALLCDATITLNLDRTDVVAAPGWDPTVAQPFLMLATFMAGACWAEVSETSVQKRPQVLAEAGVTLLGVGSALRDGLLGNTDWQAAPLRAWFRGILDPGSERWNDLAAQTAVRGIPSFSLGLAPTAGGALLFSPPLLKPQPFQCWPVPVRDFSLCEVAGPGLPALDEIGVLTPLAADKPVEGVPAIVLGRRGSAYQFAGCAQIGRGAQVYPDAEVASQVQTHPAVRSAVAIVTARRSLNDAAVALLVFCNPQRADAEGVAVAEIESLIKAGMGPGHLPDRIEWIPLRPRRTPDGVDRGWCRSQYLTGTLRAKAADPAFRLLSELAELAELNITGAS